MNKQASIEVSSETPVLISVTDFNRAKTAINELCQYFNASGSNGKAKLLMSKIRQWFIDNNIPEDAYWTRSFKNYAVTNGLK